MPRKSQKITASAEGAGTQAKRARNVAREISQDDSAARVARKAQPIYFKAAPKRSGRLARGIRLDSAGKDVILSVTAIDPKSQYDYVAVSRLGHRKRYIFPTHAPKSGNTAYLKFSYARSKVRPSPRWWYLVAVRGFRPKVDWVQAAFPKVKAIADAEMEQTGNRITARWGS